MRNKGIFASSPKQAKRESGQRDGTQDQRTTASIRQVLNTRQVLNIWTSGHNGRQAADHLATCFPSLISKISLYFAICCLRKSRENTKPPQRKSNFCPDCLKICHDQGRKGRRKGDEIEPLCYVESIQKGHPPHLGSGKSV